MSDRAFTLELTWDSVIPRSVEQSQCWVLSAMQRHGPQLVNMLWRILGDEQDVCDAYQQTFLNLAHYDGGPGPRGQKPRHIRAYVFRSANNVAITILRRRIAEQRKLVSARSARKAPAEAPGEFDSADLRSLLKQCIAKLPGHLRDVLTLHDLAELSYNQVAHILDITPATARVYRCRAVKLLAAWMSENKTGEL